MFKNIKRSLSLKSVLLFLAAALVVVSTVNPPQAAAAGETITWTDYKTLTMKGGGVYGTGTIRVSSPDLPNPTAGTGVFNIYADADRICEVAFGVTFSTDYRQVVLYGAKQSTHVSPPGTKPTYQCTNDELSRMSSYNNLQYGITNARPPNANTPETAEQKRVDVVLHRPGDATGAPASIRFTLKKAGKPDVSFTSNRSISGNQASYYGTFNNVAAGTGYSVCPSAVITQCQTFEKVLHLRSSLVFGETAAEKVINVKIDFNAVLTDPSQDQDYGPFKIFLYAADGTTIVQQKTVAFHHEASASCKNFGNCQGGALHLFQTIQFTNVNPGTYKVCYGTKCVAAPKLANTPLTVDLTFDQADVDATDGTTEPVCQGGAIGWIVCPLMKAIGGANDVIYSMVERQLFIDPITVSYGGGLYRTWTVFRDIANVAFVLAFLVVVYSQATGAGLSSYGVKKMLPRIIAAAILVNISFFLCQIALDVTNIIGKSLGDLLGSIEPGGSSNVDAISWDGLIATLIAAGASFGVYSAVAAVGGAASSAGIMAAAVMILPFAVTVLFAVLTTIVVLITRQALIILLVAISPLAFVAFILPNTAKYFERWRELFVGMLVLYPMVALLFAGSSLAASIILGAASNG